MAIPPARYNQHNQDVINGLTLADFAPQMYEMTESDIASLPITSEDCSEFAASTDSVSKGFTSIITFQLLDSDVEMEVTTCFVLGTRVCLARYANPQNLLTIGGGSGKTLILMMQQISMPSISQIRQQPAT